MTSCPPSVHRLRTRSPDGLADGASQRALVALADPLRATHSDCYVRRGLSARARPGVGDERADAHRPGRRLQSNRELSPDARFQCKLEPMESPGDQILGRGRQPA